MGINEREKNLKDTIVINDRHKDLIKGRKVMLVDDVMTTGTTLSACATACLDAGAKSVNMIVFARVASLD